MRKLKEILSTTKKGCLALLLLIIYTTANPSLTSAESINFKDTSGHWAQPYINWAVEQKLAQGYSDGSFQPNKLVSEAEFLAMLLRAYQLVTIESASTASWSKPYYDFADVLGWPVMNAKKVSSTFLRGNAALLMASAANGSSYTEQTAIQWLLDEKISNGRTSATVSGFIPAGNLTRAEALTFIYNLKVHSSTLSNKKIAVVGNTFDGIALNDSSKKLEQLFGKPSRIDPSGYGFSWYVYNGSYSHYIMIGVQNNSVKAIFSNSNTGWKFLNGMKMGQIVVDAKKLIKSPSSVETNDDYYAYTVGTERTTLFMDKHDNNKIIGIILMNAEAAKSKPSYTKELQSPFEQEIFELANAERTIRGITAFEWDDLAGASARSHSQDMMKRNFFDHTNPDGANPFDRMKKNGIKYQTAAENIAAGYPNSIYAHYGWMNSKTGHRESLLSTKLKRLGTGVAFGGSYNVYYTQNFYTSK